MIWDIELESLECILEFLRDAILLIESLSYIKCCRRATIFVTVNSFMTYLGINFMISGSCPNPLNQDMNCIIDNFISVQMASHLHRSQYESHNLRNQMSVVRIINFIQFEIQFSGLVVYYSSTSTPWTKYSIWSLVLIVDKFRLKYNKTLGRLWFLCSKVLESSLKIHLRLLLELSVLSSYYDLLDSFEQNFWCNRDFFFAVIDHIWNSPQKLIAIE